MTLPVACGDDDDSSTPITPSAGAGGEGPSTDGGAGGMAPVMLPPGISDMESTKTCGGDSCKSAAIPLAKLYVDPCCDVTDGCGLDTGFFSLVGAKFDDKCQSRNQAGDPSDTCDAVSGLKVPVDMGGTTLMVALDPLAGCCRPDGACGVVIDKVTSGGGKVMIADMGLGCVAAKPFTGSDAKCGAGSGGAGGAGGAASGGAGGALESAGGAGGAK
jgi:hypothetical protein